MSNYALSVIMPVYNGEKYLKLAIDSILAQTFTDFEFVIINDGSTDSSGDIISSYSDSRIKVLSHPHNLGIVKSLNDGVLLSTGEYIARIDSDDISLPARLESQYQYLLAHKDTFLCATNIVSINEYNIVTSKPWWKGSTNLKWDLIWGNVIPHPTVMIKRSVLPVPAYRDYKYSEDYDLWLRLLSSGDIHRMDEALVQYRLHNHTDKDSSAVSLSESYRSNLEWLSSLGLSAPVEHRWLSKFSPYGEDFGNVSFDVALSWMNKLCSRLSLSIPVSQRVKIITEATEKMKLDKKLMILSKTLRQGQVYYTFLIIWQTIKQYTRMILKIK